MKKSLIDMSPEVIAIRKKRIQDFRDEAIRVWVDGCHEGNDIEKEYFVKGYVMSLVVNSNFPYTDEEENTII